LTMQFIDLQAQQQAIYPQIMEGIKRVLAHGRYIMGPEIQELETKLAAYVGCRHAIACSSGTDALLMALMACGVGPGDAILTTPFTFVATAEVISLLGATPVFVDIDPVTFNLDPARLELAMQALKAHDPAMHPLPANHKSLALRGLVPVDLFGLPADYDRINAMAQTHGLLVIEDAAQSFGAEYHGRKSCSLADLACTSFFPAKPLGGYGDGGMCFTDDDKLAGLLRSVRIHGQGEHQYDNVRIGINGRLDSLQAAILLAKFQIFPAEVQQRQQIAAHYSQLLTAANLELTPPQSTPGLSSVWAQYSILARHREHRATLQAALKQAGIPTAIYYPKPLHLQEAFAYLGYAKGDFPVSEGQAERIFSLPMHPYLKKADQEQIVAIMSRASDL
jgi:UDP-2-acetamido-2-deoxy-ribo-hexuluronate aminotransferase